ncbi:hypothetical protein TSOC_007376, partial [Tetrabaena socialis]
RAAAGRPRLLQPQQEAVHGLRAGQRARLAPPGGQHLGRRSCGAAGQPAEQPSLRAGRGRDAGRAHGPPAAADRAAHRSRQPSPHAHGGACLQRPATATVRDQRRPAAHHPGDAAAGGAAAAPAAGPAASPAAAAAAAHAHPARPGPRPYAPASRPRPP